MEARLRAAMALPAVEWARGHFYLVAVAAVTLVAAALRFWALDSFPPGLHGDEAWTGLDARRVFDEGWIGPYVPSALGQPAGPIYWSAAVIKLLGDGVYQLRLSMALLAVATVPLTYWAAKQMFDRRVGLLAAVIMAFLSWHLLFSRTAFLVNAWPLVEVIFIGLLFAAYKRKSPVLYAAAGAALGLGVYSYNAYPVFVVAAVVFALVLLVGERARWRELAPRLALLFAVAFVVALPLVRYVMDDKNDYFAHHRLISVLQQDDYEEASLTGKAGILIDRGRDWLDVMVVRPHIDFTDASGRQPILDRLTTLLVVCGIGLCIANFRKPPYQFLLVLLLVLPIAAIITQDGAARRSLGLVPVVALLAALPLAYAWQWVDRLKPDPRNLARAGVLALLLVFAVSNVRVYFDDIGDSETARWVYVEELAEASRYIASLPGKPYVYFYSSRWSYFYETRRYIAPDLLGEDRSTEFRFDPPVEEDSEFDPDPPASIEFDATRPAVVLLLPPYIDLLEEIKERYSGGREYIGRRGKDVLFAAYVLPP